jgi:hypothetical protein
MNKKVYLNLKGGMGNQIFQLSAALNYCFNNNYKNLNIYTGNLSKFQKKRNFELKNLLKVLDFPINIIETDKLFFNKYLLHFLLYIKNPFIKIVTEKNFDTTQFAFFKILDGYFQRESFLFANNSITILSKTFIKAYHNGFHLNLNNKIINFDNSYALHIRGTDFLQDKNYCQNSSFNIVRTLNIQELYIFTDDKLFAEKQLAGLNLNLLFISDFKLTDFEEFILLSKFNNVILTNSTFSLTSAILGYNSKKNVYTPINWVNKIDDNLELIKINKKYNFNFY